MSNQVSPMIFIGVGGTGTEILNSLHRKIKGSEYGRYLDQLIHFYAIDTRPANQDAGALPPERFFPSTAFNGTQLVRNLWNARDENETFPEWWPLEKAKVRGKVVERPYQPGMINDGAGCRRVVGRLAFKRLLDDDGPDGLIRALQMGRDRCFDVVARMSHDLTLQPARHVHVFIVSGLSGGTGSGMFLDAARLARHVFQGSQPLIAGVSVLCDVAARRTVSNVDHMNFAANTFAALLEVNHFQRHDEETPRVFSSAMSRHLDYEHPLFNVCQLVDFTDEERNNYGSYDTYVELTSQYLFNIAANPILSLDYFGILDNHLDRIRERPAHLRAPVTFGSFGISRLRFPVDRVSDWMVDEFTVGFLNGLLRSGEVGAEATERALAGELGLDSLGALRGALLAAAPEAPNAYNKFPAARERNFQEVFKKNAAGIVKWRDRLASSVRASEAELIAGLEQEIRSHIEKLYLEPGGPTLHDVDEILRQLGTRLTGHADAFKAEAADADSSLRELGLPAKNSAVAREGRLPAAFRRLKDAYGTVFNFGVDKLKGEVVNQWGKIVDAVTSRAAADSGARVTAAVAEWISHLREVIPHLREYVLDRLLSRARGSQDDIIRRAESHHASMTGGNRTDDLLRDKGLVLEVFRDGSVIRETLYREITENAHQLAEIRETLRQTVFDEGLKDFWDAVDDGEAKDRRRRMGRERDRLKTKSKAFGDRIRAAAGPVFASHIAKYDVWQAIEKESLHAFRTSNPHARDSEAENAFVRRAITRYVQDLQRLCASLCYFDDSQAQADGVQINMISVLAGHQSSFNAMKKQYNPALPAQMLHSVENTSPHELVLVVSKSGYPLYTCPEINVDCRTSYDKLLDSRSSVIHTDRRYPSSTLLHTFDRPDDDHRIPILFFLAEHFGYIAAPKSVRGRESGAYKYMVKASADAKGLTLISKVRGRTETIEKFPKSPHFNEIVRGIRTKWDSMTQESHFGILETLIDDLQARQQKTRTKSLGDEYNANVELVRRVQDMMQVNPLAISFPEV